MMIYKVLLPLIVGETRQFICDAVEYKNALWLVPTWNENLDLQLQWPERIIRVDCPGVRVSLLPGIDLEWRKLLTKDQLYCSGKSHSELVVIRNVEDLIVSNKDRN